MDNRFFDMNDQLACRPRSRRRGGVDREGLTGFASSLSNRYAREFSADQRVLVILIENGGVDLGIPELVEKLMDLVPGSNFVPDSYKQQFIDYLRDKIKAATDSLIETAELTLNRYNAAKPNLFSDVIVLRDSTASYEELKRALISQSTAGKVIDVMILTHGGVDTICLAGNINGAQLKAMRTEYGKPLNIRSVYMMNCNGSTLNSAWRAAGARVSSGATLLNYLPEPTTHFFWQNWKNGQPFQNAVTSAYHKTIDLMNGIVRTFLKALPIPGIDSFADGFDFASMDFVQQSNPVIDGAQDLTINSDELPAVAMSLSTGLVTTVIPKRRFAARSMSDGVLAPVRPPMTLSPAGADFIKQWEATTAGSTKGDADAQRAVNEAVTIALNQNQNDALVSLVTNIGAPAFKQSTLLRLLNKADPKNNGKTFDGIPDEMKKWIRARRNGQVVELPELVQRRAAEAELFKKPVSAAAEATAQSRSVRPVRGRYVYHAGPSLARQQTVYSRQQNPAAVVIAGMTVGDAAQVGLGAVSVIQSAAQASSGSFTLTFDKAQRLLTNEARQAMPGAQKAKRRYSTRLFFVGADAPNAAYAEVVIEWGGNDYGEIETPIIRRDLQKSTEWSKSSCNFTITNIATIPAPQTDPRTWPIVYTYEGRYDPYANGDFEFSGEFEVNAFGGLKFNKHIVVSRSLIDFAIGGSPEDYVVKGNDIVVPVPTIPQEQIDYLRTKLP